MEYGKQGQGQNDNLEANLMASIQINMARFCLPPPKKLDARAVTTLMLRHLPPGSLTLNQAQ